MIYTEGNKGRSKKGVRLQVDTVNGRLVFRVWEDGKLTHFFPTDEVFLSGVKTYAEIDQRKKGG